MKISSLLMLFACLAPLGACADLMDEEGQSAPHFGEAQRHNFAVQVVNPNAGAAAEGQNMDGQKAASALDRYEKGKVTTPALTDIGGVGASGGSSGK